MDVKKNFKKIYRKIRRKKEIDTPSGIKTAVQDIFAQFHLKMYDMKLANYPSIKDLGHDYSEILLLFFEDDSEKLLKKLIFTLFVPFLYAEMKEKERKLSEKYVLNLYKRLEDLRHDIESGKEPNISFRKTFLPKDEISETQ